MTDWGGGGRGHVKTSKLRKKTLSLHFDWSAVAGFSVAWKNTSSTPNSVTEDSRWNQYIMATSLFQGQIWKEGEETVECLAER